MKLFLAFERSELDLTSRGLEPDRGRRLGSDRSMRPEPDLDRMPGKLEPDSVRGMGLLSLIFWVSPKADGMAKYSSST